MSKLNRTLSYLKRNGMRSTYAAVLERIDKKGMDSAQRRANAYVRTQDGDYDWTVEAAAGERTKQQLFTGERAVTDAASQDAARYTFSILVPAYETKEHFLRQMIDSVLGQTYARLQLVIADASPSDAVRRVVQTYLDDRITYLKLEENAGISKNTNHALDAAKGDFIGLLDHDDLLHREALMEIARLLEQQDCDFIYTDEDKVSEDLSQWFEPNFKPDFNLDFLLSNNYICHFAVMRAELMKKLRFRPAYDGAQDYDLFLQAVYEIGKSEQEPPVYTPSYMQTKIGHVKRILYHWRAHSGSTADNPESKRYAYEAGKRALEEFARVNDWKTEVHHTAHLGFYDVQYIPDLFSVRSDVAAVCGRKIKHGRVVGGPILENEQLFLGMKKSYSGYMHRAAMKLDVDSADEDCIIWRREETGEEKAKEGRMVYLPDCFL